MNESWPAGDASSGRGGNYTRRQALQLAGAGALALGLGGGLGNIAAACGGSQPSTTSSVTSAASPTRGGVLRVGASGGGSQDMLDGHQMLSNVDFALGYCLYDVLTWCNEKGEVELRMAEEFSANKDATEWTIRLQPGTKCHDGRDFTAKDVLWNFKRIVDLKLPGGSSIGPIDLAASKVVDARTLRVVFSTPYSIFPEAISVPYFCMMPEGWTAKNPVGTGAFVLKSFTPGEGMECTRFADYWAEGLPYLDGVHIINIADEQSQVNALQSGQVEVIDYLSLSSIQALANTDMTVMIANSAGWLPFTMRVDTPPFDDVNVRQALRFGCDRQQYLDLIYGGHGALGNDISFMKPGVPLFDESIPQRELDVEQAKSLLKKAGQENLSLTLMSPPVAPAEQQIAQVFAQQMKAIGVNIKIQTVTVTEFFAKHYLNYPFTQDYWYYVPYLSGVSQGQIPGAPFNATHWNDKEYGSLWQQATSTTDTALQADLAHQMMKIENDRSGNIIPFFYPVTDASLPTVHGLANSVSAQALDNFNFRSFWMES